MEPRDRSFLTAQDPAEPDTEEPLDVPDYYDAFQAEWLESDADGDPGPGINPVEAPSE